MGAYLLNEGVTRGKAWQKSFCMLVKQVVQRGITTWNLGVETSAALAAISPKSASPVKSTAQILLVWFISSRSPANQAL